MLEKILKNTLHPIKSIKESKTDKEVFRHYQKVITGLISGAEEYIKARMPEEANRLISEAKEWYTELYDNWYSPKRDRATVSEIVRITQLNGKINDFVLGNKLLLSY